MHIFRTIGAVGTTAVFLLSAGVAFAESQPTPSNTANVTGAERAMTVKGDIEKSTREKAKEIRDEATARIKAVATTTRAEMKEIKQTTKERMEVVREEAKARMATQREKALQRASEIQDKKKQQMIQKLTTQFEDLNKTWTDKFMQLLDHYDTIVQKMQSRAATAAANGKDVTAANAAIIVAENVIATTRADVAAQAAKTYVPDTSTIITTTATTTAKGQEELMRGLKSVFQGLHTALFTDLFTLRGGPMATARQAVQDALQALGKVSGINEGNATSTRKSD